VQGRLVEHAGPGSIGTAANGRPLDIAADCAAVARGTGGADGGAYPVLVLA